MPPRIKSESMSKVDAAWLHMERRTNMMMITGVMMFDQPIDMQRLKDTYANRLVALMPRFKQRVKEGSLLSGPRWECDPHFTIDAHLHLIALPAPGDQVALQDLVGDLMSTPLDTRKPLWEVHLVEGYGAGCAVVTRLAHAIGDGLAMMQVLLNLTDPDPDAPWPEPATEYEYPQSLLTRVVVPAMSALDSTMRLGETIVHESKETLVHPTRLLGSAKAGAGYALALGKLLLIGPDQNTLFKGRLGTIKRAAWTQPLVLADVKDVGKALCGTINDVLLACVAGGLRRYIEDRGGSTEGLNIRALVPVNLRKPEEMGKLGNRFGLIFLSLPIGIQDPLERLHTLKRRMDAIKNSPEALVAYDILNTIGLTPRQAERLIVNIFAMKGTSVMTNVAGPRETLYLAGAPMRGMMFWVPTSGDISLGVSIFSYAGTVIIGISTDAGLAPDPECIAAAIEAEFAEMRCYVREAQDRCSQENSTALVEDIGLPMEDAPEVEVVQLNEAPCGEVELEPEQLVPALEQAAQAAASRPSQLPIMTSANGHCQAVTKSGQPCRNHALAGQSTCRVHAGKG